MLANIVLTTTCAMRRSVPDKRGTGVKSEPTESQNECANQGHRQTVARNGLWFAIDVLTDARANHDCARESNNAAHRMNYAGAREIDRPVAQTSNSLPFVRANLLPIPNWHKCSMEAQPKAHR